MPRSVLPNRRPGGIAPLTAVMLVALIAMVAFAVDTSWMVLTKSELQNSADAAALAGAQKLVKNFPLYSLPKQTQEQKNALAGAAAASARSTAASYGAVNGAGGKSNLTYLDSDIEVGFTDSKGVFTAYASGGNYPNTVKVRGRRDGSANSPLSLFFGAVLGTKSVPLTATATSTLYTANVDGFTAPKTGNVSLLPFTYDVNHWKNFIETSKDADGGTSSDASKNPTLQVYPSIKYSGNFGQLSLSDSSAGSSQMRNWVANGMSQSDLSVLTEKGLLPLSSHDPTKWDWQGSPGFEASLIQTVNDNVDKIYWMPLFQPVDSRAGSYTPALGSGSGYNYNIVAFVPVKIVPSKNSNREVTIQPVDLIDSSANFDSSSLKPAGSGGSNYYSAVLAPRLTN